MAASTYIKIKSMWTNKFLFILLAAILSGTFISSQAQVKITDGADLTLDPNSLLELESTSKGLLIPRMAINDVNLVAPLTAPVPTGMLVYSTGGTVTDGFYYWNGSQWKRFVQSTVQVNEGGTGLSTFGGINTVLYTSATDALSSVATSTVAGQFLQTTTPGSAPTWKTILDVANGGTGSSTQNYVDLTTDQTVAGAKTWSDLGTFNLGLTASGATVNINASSNFNTNINTGTSTGAVAIGSITGTSSVTLRAGSGNVVIPNSVMFDMSQVDNSSTTEGLKLPQSNNNASATAEGQMGWDADNDVLTVGTGTIARNIGIPNGIAVFTSSDAAWAHPVGVKYVWVKVWGGGGGGGNASSNDSKGGGGGGAYSEGIVDISDAATHAIVVGAGGTANGGNGGATSFTATAMTVSASGGSGTTTTTGAAGGPVLGTGTIKIPGSNGGNGSLVNNGNAGSGGGSPFGGAGGHGGSSGSNNGTVGTFPGGGGGGGSEAAGVGAAGAAGYVIVYW